MDYSNIPPLKDQVDKMGLEFSTDLELYRENGFVDIYNTIVEFYKVGKDINEVSETGFPMVQFLQAFYDAGFYRGASFGMYAQENFEVSDMDMMVKRQDEIMNEALI